MKHYRPIKRLLSPTLDEILEIDCDVRQKYHDKV